MKGLMDLLSKSDKDAPTSDSPSFGLDGDSEAAPASAESFEASASAAMDAMKSGDSEGFAEALRACIEMSA